MGDDRCADAQEIGEVLVRYATGIDQRDWELFRTCFTDDVSADYEGIGSWDGVEAIVGFMRDVHADLGPTLHRLSNLAIEVSGDRATARTYVDAVIMAADGASAGNPIGYYDDDLVRTADGWRIGRRRFTAVHFGAL